jgi:DNA-directed RNA polymerase subunit RPC12/RpoP
MGQFFLDNNDSIHDLQDYLEQKPVLCRYCGNNEIIKKGVRVNKAVSIQEYKCKKCGRKFTDNITRYGNQELWVHDHILELTVNSVRSSAIIDILKKVALEKGKEIHITKPTIHNIVKKDCQFLSTLEYNLNHPNMSRVWEIDETFDFLKNRKKCKVFNIKAVDTKFWLVSYVSLKRTQMAQRIALTYAFLRAGYAPTIVRSDGFAPNLKSHKGPMKFVKVEAISKDVDYSCINNVERINVTMREIIKKGSCSYSLEYIQSRVELKRLHYNFLRKHPSFSNFTPAKLAGIDLPIKSWTDLFKIADYFDRTKMRCF